MFVGCWFGVEDDPKLGMFIPGVDPCELATVDTSIDAESLSRNLTELLFTEDEMAFGCATKPRRLGIINLTPKTFMQSEVSVCIIKITTAITTTHAQPHTDGLSPFLWSLTDVYVLPSKKQTTVSEEVGQGQKVAY